MTKRVICLGLCVALMLAVASPTGSLAATPSNSRETPLVRAIKRAKTAVVNIHSEKTARSDDAVFTPGPGRKINGMGTGVIIDERGYIVTNYHVIKDVDVLRATTENGNTYDARVVTYDREHDLAIIKIDAQGPLTVMPLGISSDLMLGETVIAVGNAYGYEHTVTSGIISSLSRDVEVNETQSYKNLIQTDASINPGNSGGPLLNLEGEVVGINVAIRAGAQRIGFAIPIDDAREIVAQLLDSQQISQTYVGLTGHDEKSPEQRKMLIDAVETNSPAQDAGLQSGDVVLKAGEIDVQDGVDFQRALIGRKAGDSLDVVIVRDDSQQTLTMKLREGTRVVAKLPANTEPVIRGNNAEAVGDKAWKLLGVRLTEIPHQAASLSSTKYRGGMRVEEVRSGSPAEINGIRSGDILVGLHTWETIKEDNVSYVLNHPQLNTFSPLKFFVLRGRETMYGYIRLADAAQ